MVWGEKMISTLAFIHLWNPLLGYFYPVLCYLVLYYLVLWDLVLLNLVLDTSCFGIWYQDEECVHCPMLFHTLVFFNLVLKNLVLLNLVLLNLVLLNLVLGTSCFGALVWYEDEECVHHCPMSVFNRLPGIRDFPTRNPAVLRSIACKILETRFCTRKRIGKLIHLQAQTGWV